MKRFFPWSFWLTCLLISSALCNPEVQLTSRNVTYRGKVARSIEYFHGIRFAEDTSGNNRFAPPKSYIPEENSVIDASEDGSFCPQFEGAIPLTFDETPEMSEDCLNLRIARLASTSPRSKLPVVVWLHGGGVVKGSAYDSHFDPEPLLELASADETPIIFAAIQYRMTMFGFPRLPFLKNQKSLNLGFRDQRLGLQWIRDNIDAFGGDPERITVYGLSAGGTFSSLHTLAYGGVHGVPFQQAWMMSGPPGTALSMNSDETTRHTKEVAERLDCKGNTASDEDILACLRGIPMQELLKVAMTYSQEGHPPFGTFTFIPSIDDDIFPDLPSSLYKAGRFVKGIKMVFGWTQDDGATNAGSPYPLQSEEDMIQPIRLFGPELSEGQISGLFDLYPSSAFQHELENYDSRKAPEDPTVPIHFFRLSRILRDVLFTCSSIEFGYQMYKETRKTQPGFDAVRLYNLNQTVFAAVATSAGMPYLGAFHGADTPYIFNGYPEGQFDEANRILAASFSRSLIQFAYTGTPSAISGSSDRSSEWPAAYTSVTLPESAPLPSSFNLDVIGGPYGSGTVAVVDQKNKSTLLGFTADAQQVLNNVLGFGSMSSAASQTTRERLVWDQDLHQRCAYIKSLDMALGH